MHKFLTILFSLFIVASCSMGDREQFQKKNKEVVNFEALSTLPTTKVDYHKQVKPILDNRCVVCHGCYDAPCQLKLSSYEGLMRGANKELVYDGARIKAMEPTRLFIDAVTKDQWREKEFYPVVADSPSVSKEEENLNNSVLYRMLRLKEMYPQPRSGLLPSDLDISLDRKQYCPTLGEFDEFEKEHQALGMPFGTPNLSRREFLTLTHWIAQGAHGDDKKVESAHAKRMVKKFEKFFNGTSKKQQLASRYIYEHVFLAHIHFKNDSKKNFYRLVRAKNRNGEPEEVDAIRPYDDPKEKFFYRLKLYRPSIVAKTHNVYEFSNAKLRRYKQLFLMPKYKVDHLPSYKPEVASNPFKVFEQIPVKSRYQFMLDDSRFYIEGFIKGPVCRGQVALNVIEDRFWVYFFDPDAPLTTNRDSFVNSMKDYLQLPADRESHFEFLSIWTDYWKKQKKYIQAREERFKNAEPRSMEKALASIWDGDKKNPNAALTVFRHLDSASVREGLIGTNPETVWILDYPLLERIHYLLAAGFNVYGNVGHQLKTRLYMDFLRMEGENMFLSYLPVKERKKLHESWYGGNRNHVKSFRNEPLEWLEHDFINDYKKGHEKEQLIKALSKRVSKAISSKRNRVPRELKEIDYIKGEALEFFPEITYLKYENEVYTLTHNKEYKHVSFILEDQTKRDHRDIDQDSLTVVRGYEGSYPNLFIKLSKNEVSHFIADLKGIKSEKDFNIFLAKYGVRRTHPSFWGVSDWFHLKYKSVDPVRAGILDLNRYIH